MPWKEISVPDLRKQFIALYNTGDYSVAYLCRHFGISRVTGYECIRNYLEFGETGLVDQSRAPYSHPNATPKRIQEMIVDLRTDHPTWGARKLRARLADDYPDLIWPAASTIGDLLKSRNLILPRRRSRAAYATPTGLTCPDSPNDVWTADFKGEFRLANQVWCFPLTICDRYSRMILACNALETTATDPAKAVWVATFREYGLPKIIRTDNGAPFATVAISGLSRLAIWWIRLGILPEHIAPGRPGQNGSHERMHRTLKAEVASKPRNNFRAQQQAFNDFVQEYNYARPHEALGQVTPATVYSPSPREYPLILPEIQYPTGIATRHVRTNGQIRWQGGLLFLSATLAGEHVAFEQIDERNWAFYYGPFPFAILDEATKTWSTGPKARKLLQELRKETLDEH